MKILEIILDIAGAFFINLLIFVGIDIYILNDAISDKLIIVASGIIALIVIEVINKIKNTQI